MNRFSPRRWVVLWRRTLLLDRVAAAFLLVYGIARLSYWAGHPFPLSALAGFLGFLAAAYFLFRLVPWFRARFMWRLRNRLIVTYIFIAVVPVILLLTMAGVASYLVYLELGAHLLHDDLQDRISTIAADAEAIAGAVQQEVQAGADTKDDAVLARPAVATVIAAAEAGWPGLRLYLNRGEDLVTGGDGRHFAGIVEFERKLWFASVESRKRARKPFSVVALAPINSELLDRLASELGPIQVVLFEPAPKEASARFTYEAQGLNYVTGDQISSRRRALVPPSNFLDVRVNGASIFDVKHLEDGSAPSPVLASFSLRPSALNRWLFTSVGELGPALTTVLLVVGIIFLVLEVAALATGVVMTRTITRAIADLYQATLHVRRGDFTYRVRVKQRDQLGALGESFNEMTASVSDLLQEQRHRQRLENEISIAREVQEQLFPSSLPSLPGLQLAAICRPARVVSGDYYDFIRLSPERVGIALADISGKGIFAALLMASLQAALRSTAALDGKGGTAELVSRLNKHLFKNTSDDRYATFFYAVYDSDKRTLTYTNAGHLPPVFVSDAGVQQLDEGGTVVGLFEDCPYRQRVLKVMPGSVLVAFSDGLTEPENVYGEEFGSLRLREEILRQRSVPAERLAENLIAAAEQWAGTPEQVDDMTVVVARMS